MRFEKAPATLADIEALESQPLHERVSFNTPYEIIQAAAKQWPEKTAIYFLPQGDPKERAVTITYQQLFSQINQAAHLFLHFQKNHSNVVSYLLPNIPQTHVVLWGAQAVGIVNPIRPDFSPEQIADLLQKANSQIVVTIPPILENILKARALYPALKTILVIGGQDNPEQHIYNWDKLLDEQSSQFTQRLSPDAICAYFHTSATTTPIPKLVRLTQRGLVCSAWMIGTCLGFQHDDVIGVGLPFFHVGAPMVGGLVPFMCGAATVMMSAMGWMSPTVINSFWEIVSRYKITITAALNFMYDQLLPTAVRGSLRLAIAGTPVSANTANDYAALGINVVDIYGSSETTIACFNPPAAPKASSMGFRFPYEKMRITRPDGMECHTNEIGELWISGPTITQGYQTRETPILFEWLKTGDLVHQDEDGRLWFFDRVADAIHKKTGVISSLWLEQLFEKHPAVERAAVIAQPDSPTHTVPVLYVTTKSGQFLQPSELQQWAIDHQIDPLHCPADIHIETHFPLNGIAKVLKPLLRIQNLKNFFATQLNHFFKDTSPHFEITTEYNAQGKIEVHVHLSTESSAEEHSALHRFLSGFGEFVHIKYDELKRGLDLV